MKKLLQLLCIATLFVFVACSPKSDEIWVKFTEDRDFINKYEKRLDGWYILKLSDISKDNKDSDFEDFKNYLTEVKLPNGLRTIEKNAFSYCPILTSIKIPKSVIVIEQYAFEQCPSLTSIDLPNVRTIEGNAFHGCSGLTSINLQNVRIIEHGDFSF